MIIKNIEVEQFRSISGISFDLGKKLTAIAGRNATQKTTLLGMLGQPFSISEESPLFGCSTVDGYNFKSQFKEKFKLSINYEPIGSHKWTLNFHNKGYYQNNKITIHSIPRKQKGKPDAIRFWNAEGKSKGAGYVQLPVYYLSLSRLFPIGESSKTNTLSINLTPTEIKYCVKSYREILSITQVSGSPTVSVEKGSGKQVYAGVNDGLHDIFTNSAGEGNISRIILAVLSFKRLKDKYKKNYKGGILLIDELDATLYGFSQKKLLKYLLDSAKEYKIQIIFTTHSPIILNEMYKLQKEEIKKSGIKPEQSAYDTAIVYLSPTYKEDGSRMIKAENVSGSTRLNEVINDINLVPLSNTKKINAYFEDEHALTFGIYMLKHYYSINFDNYINFVDVNLGWTNYLQLYKKKIPEFTNSIINFDADVPTKKEYHTERQIVESSNNILFLPLEIEKGLFAFLKNHANFINFETNYSNISTLTYDICFNEWPLEIENYETKDFKKWYENITTILGGPELLFKCWIDSNEGNAKQYVIRFVEIYNYLSDIFELDHIPALNS